MAEISKSAGVTSTERYLAKLAHRTFLELWSYPNVYRDVVLSGGRTMGKEVCDLLVICGDHVIIFSDKAIKWPATVTTDVAWCRWYRQAIEKSVKQVRGAQRWITEHPDRLFLDASCKHKLPLDLPPLDRRKVHGIVVATGAAAAKRTAMRTTSGSLTVKPAVFGDAHRTPTAPEFEPFAVGDVDPAGPFVHILDEVSLGLILRELDTVSDFTEYLGKKALLLRSQRLQRAAGEEELLAWYLTSLDEDGERNFEKPSGGPWLPLDHVVVVEGAYQRLRNHPQYVARQREDRVSYMWDRLIGSFTDHIAAGTLETDTRLTATPLPGINQLEIGVRYMALEPRLQRRVNAQALLDGFAKTRGKKLRFFRALMPRGGGQISTTFCFLLLPFNGSSMPGPAYIQYRQMRTSMLATYALTMLEQHREIERVVGIALETPTNSLSGGGSEDMVVIEQPDWTEEYLAETREMAKFFRIFEKGATPEYEVSTTDFPTIPTPPGLNRRERRAWKAKRRKPR